MSTETTKELSPAIYLRAGRNELDPSEAVFDLLGAECLLHVYPDGTAKAFKLKNGKPGSKPIAQGQFKPSGMTSAKAPQLTGIIETAKGSKFRLYGWLHSDDFESYWVLRYDTLVRKGQLYMPTAA